MSRVPKTIYLERWPERLGRDDRVYYEQTGYGIDLATGEASRIHVYELVKPKKPRKRKPTR